MSDASPVERLFDALAPDYDQSGVDFFQPIAALLVDALDPQPGERCLDVGCGRGAATRLLAERAGPTGEVLGVDLSEEMVRLASGEVAGARFEVGDAAAPGPDDADWDVVASSLVLFFLPDPVAALGAWRSRMRPGGRLGVTTFGPQDDTFRAVDELLRPWMPGQDPRSAQMMQRFRSDEGVEQLLEEAGFSEVRTETRPLPVVLDDADHWYRFTTSTGQRVAWLAMPEDQRPAVRRQAEELLQQARRPDGRIELTQHVRVTLGRS